MTTRAGQRRRPVTNYDYGIGDLLSGGLEGIWDSGLLSFSPNHPTQQLGRMEPPENLTPEARANYQRHLQNNPDYQALWSQIGEGVMDPSSGMVAGVTKMIRPVRQNQLVNLGLLDNPGGRYMTPDLSQDLTGNTYQGMNISTKGGKRSMVIDDETITRQVVPKNKPGNLTSQEKADAKLGKIIKVNLMDSKRSKWEWVDPEGNPVTPPDSADTLVSVHDNDAHFYTLNANYDTPVTLKTYPREKSEPRLKPTTRGDVDLSNSKIIGYAKKGKHVRPVYDQVNIVPRGPKTEPVSGKAPSVKSNINYEDPTGLLDLSKLETDYPNIPQTREPLFVPQKPKVSDELITFQSPEQQKKLTDWMEAGMKTGGMAWYNTNPLKKFAQSEYGERGEELYDRFMRYVAALSPNTAPVPNIKQASYYNTLDEAGIPLGVFREGDLEIPKGYGRLSMKGVDKTLAAAQNPTRGPVIGPKGTDIKTEDLPLYARESYSGMFGATAPKVGRFYQNLTGNIEDMATLDAGAMRSMAGKTDPKYITEKNKTGKRPSAQKEIYDQMEVAFNEFAHKQGVPPASAQAAIWTASAPYTGVGKKTAGLREGASFMEMLMQRVQITAKELNMKPKDVLKGVLEGNTVLKNMVGPIAAGATAQGLISEEN
ncbi:hypothetical protein [uncultured Mediterranean phage uvMED]|nr:hypothetical protein [uncultured Mediterranean phage uvMED]